MSWDLRDRIVVGVDEAGRGPLAGPVVAAAVVLPRLYELSGLDDSKVVSPKRRRHLERLIKTQALSWSIGRAEVEEIDRLNILQATLLAMQRAVSMLNVAPDLALVDGNQAPSLTCRVQTIVKGDATEPTIAAASILAKVYRDRVMRALDARFPGYGFADNKGYPTPRHLQALRERGVTRIHRRSFRPVRSAINRTECEKTIWYTANGG
ncbi:MAG: ribonuclease HII [Gammaproteobacteria bacterium]|nr:ribonuclease HII [Gammaproteobacteria bacterium]